jgi:hypothetical protein
VGRETLRRQPAAVRFQAEPSYDCWQFDLSPSNLKEVKEPLWLQASKGAPTLMLFSLVDDRSGVAYQEYRCVYGEDVEAALRFLFNAMALKQINGSPFQGIPKIIYLDNGPVIRATCTIPNCIRAWKTGLRIASLGSRAVCSWERFCTFAREPERRKVGSDARVSVAGVNYEVDPDLAGEQKASRLTFMVVHECLTFKSIFRPSTTPRAN